MKELGKYMIFLGRVFTNREPFRVYVKLFFDECILIGINSLFIVAVISTFIGAVTAVQTAHDLASPLYPKSLIAFILRDMTILELAPTLTSLVFAGKVGSNIAGTLGTMRITEQIDALEVMGINSASYLVLPRIAASLVTYPMLVIIAAFLAHIGGYLASMYGDLLTSSQFTQGLRMDFNPFNITFMIIKAYVFAFIVVSISAFQGFYTKGGALEVGESSTVAVTKSCIAILVADFVLAKMLVG